MYAYGFRYYDPAIGRFTGVDPIADEFAWVSTYNYAENEPVRHIDLHGLQKYDPQTEQTGPWSNEYINEQEAAPQREGTALSEPENTSKNSSALEPSSSVGSAISLSGAAVTSIGDFNVSDGKYRGASGRYYSIEGRKGWNQYTGTKAKMNARVSIAKTATRLSRGLGVVNTGISTSQWLNGDLSDTAFGIELSSTGIGTFAPPIISIPWTIGYEVLGRQGVTRIPAYQDFKNSRTEGGIDGLIILSSVTRSDFSETRINTRLFVRILNLALLWER